MPITFDHDAAVERILHVSRLATHEQVDDGMMWYQDTHNELRTIAHIMGYPARDVFGIMAALSPGIPYSRNVALTKDMLKTGDCAHPYGDAIRKARAIREYGAPLDILGGAKVLSFFDNINDPDRSQAVTVDRHAYAITVAETFGPRGGADIRYQDLSRKGAYEAVAQAYRAAAEYVGIMPHQMQAITWTTWRGDGR